MLNFAKFRLSQVFFYKINLSLEQKSTFLLKEKSDYKTRLSSKTYTLF